MKKSFFRRIDIYFPWLKLIVVLLLGVFAILDLTDVMISNLKDPESRIKVAPMSRHIRATNRILDGKMLVALTFDDGPSSETTPQLLDILYEKEVPSTFFILGSRARNNPDLVRDTKTKGNEIASHTMYHQNLIRIPVSSAEADINESRAVFEGILGSAPALTRPPYGNANDKVKNLIGTPLILWSVDTLDWKNQNTESIVATTMSEIHDGAIILMHDIYPTTVEAVPVLIDAVRNAGYEFVTISELTEKRQIKLENGASYYNFRP